MFWVFIKYIKSKSHKRCVNPKMFMSSTAKLVLDGLVLMATGWSHIPATYLDAVQYSNWIRCRWIFVFDSIFDLYSKVWEYSKKDIWFKWHSWFIPSLMYRMFFYYQQFYYCTLVYFRLLPLKLLMYFKLLHVITSKIKKFLL